MGLRSGDSRDLAQSGWGVIFATEDPQADATKEALLPLLELRRSQIGAREHYYRELAHGKGYRCGDTKRSFLTRHGVGPGAADPEFMPYYLLIVGHPNAIPYEFQRQLDMQYAVGRLYFRTLEDYTRYARNVVDIETRGSELPRSVTFFAPQHPNDPVTEFFASQLASPLAARASRQPGWEVLRIFGEDATKSNLLRILRGEKPTGLLFTAGHGVVFSADDPQYESCQGALLCSEWPGPLSWKSAIPSDCFCSARDLADPLALKGLVSFHYSAYSMGWPAPDDTGLNLLGRASSQPQLARLPQRFLESGALAVVGSTGSPRAGLWPSFTGHLQMIEDIVDRLLGGHPVGSALEPSGIRYADLSADLSATLEDIRQGGAVDDEQLADLWVSSKEASSYSVLGDPAVRLCPL